ncbi:hypothetical protein ACWXWK_19200 [Pantoea ananatis]
MKLSESIKPSDYDEILEILNKRAKSARITIITLIYVLIIALTLVFLGIFYTKNNEDAPLTKFINGIMSSGTKEKNQLEEYLRLATRSMAGFKNSQSERTPPNGTLDEDNIQLGDRIWLGDTTSAKIADSIASVLLSLSLMIFIGFVMKAILVFTKYYMQLGTDFENQKIAFVLSKGNNEEFNSILDNLRKHNITFEKTPNLPQEKILLAVIDALKNNRAN